MVQVLLGISGPMLGKIMQDPIAAIKREFAQHGSAEDKSNLARVLDGSFDGKTLEVLVVHRHARMAKLEVQHVLALRMYTTSSFSCINDPLRMKPPQRCDARPVFLPSRVARIAVLTPRYAALLRQAPSVCGNDLVLRPGCEEAASGRGATRRCTQPANLLAWHEGPWAHR